MRPENKKMKDFLLGNGINCQPKFFWKSSVRDTWRLYGRGQRWTDELQEKLTALGFRDFDGKPLGQFSGNGGAFMVFVIAPRICDDFF